MDRRRIYDYEYQRRLRKAYKASASARLSLWLEEIFKATWRPVSWAAFLIGLMFLSLPSLFGQTGWIIAGILFWIGFAYLLIEDFKKFKRPSETKILKRVQEDNNLDYRPLEILKDAPSGIYTTLKKRLWRISSKRAAEDSHHIRMSFPTLCVSFLDHFGFRLMAFITFFAGMVIAGGQAYDRAMQGLVPFGGLGSNASLNYTIWIKAPSYTGLGDIVFDKTSAEDQKTFPIIPEGSTIKATVDGLWGPAWLKLYVGDTKILSKSFAHIEDESFMTETTVPSYDLPQSTTAKETKETSGAIGQNGTLNLRNLIRNFVSLDYTYRPDETPTLIWSDEKKDAAQSNTKKEKTKNKKPEISADKYEENPKKISSGEAQDFGMRFPITMQDDYGIKSLEVHLKLADSVTDKPYYNGENHFTKPISTAAGSSYSTNSFFDLSAHPYAGLPVKITITAIDDAGQKATTTPRLFTLKERVFSHLLAQKLVNMRKKLIWDGVAAAPNIAFDLKFQLQYPEDMRDNPSIWLALKNVKAHLENAKSNQDIAPIIETLWTIALDLEDMGLSKAARDLERITSKITRALRSSKTPDTEKLALFNEYREKMARYLDKLREFNENRDTDSADISEDLMRDLLNPAPLQEMLDQMELLAENGDYDSLEDMIADLQSLLESFALGGGMPPELKAMQKGLDVMQGLIDNQKHLLAETQELAKRIPESIKLPQKGFGEAITPPSDIFQEWYDGDIPPPPANNKILILPQKGMNLPKPPLGLGQVPIPDNLQNSERPKSPFETPKKDRQQQEEDSANAKPEIYDDTLPDTQEEANIQEVLRFILGEVMGEVFNFTDKLPETMPLAELEMRKSTHTLDEDRPDESVPVQEEVIRLLEQAQKELQKQMQEQMQQNAGGAGSGIGSRFRPRSTDPLGRPTNPDEDNNMFADDSEVEIPDSFNRRRIDEILNYLRKNSGDPERSRIEREYFQRLLKQF